VGAGDRIVLRGPSESREASVGLHLLVKNGESVVRRLLSSVGPYLVEVVAVVNDTSDDTVAVLRSWERRDLVPGHRRPSVDVVEVTAATHPHLYLLDVPETYDVGESLVGERYEGPFTGQPLLADWAAARNLGWQLHRARWRLFLDVDDVVDDPQSLPGLCELLEERGFEAASTRYLTSTSGGSRERLARCDPRIRWEGKVHERLVGYDPARVAHVDGSLVVRDMRDSSGSGLRAPGRNLKVLYHQARSSGWDMSNRDTLYLAAEAKTCMPRLAAALLERYLPRSTWPAEAAWACSMLGEICEDEQSFAQASWWYERAIDYYPSVSASMRLCRSRLREGRHAEAVVAYEQGLRHMSEPQPLDQSDLLERSTPLLVAAALRELGRRAEAVHYCEVALAQHPGNRSIEHLLDVLRADDNEESLREYLADDGRLKS